MAFRYYSPRTTGPSRGSSTGQSLVIPVQRPPALATARILSILSVVALLVIAGYVGLAIYSATQVNASSGGWHTTTLANDAIELNANATIRNPEFFSVTALTVVVAVSPWPPCGGGVVDASIVRAGSIPAESTVVLPITIQLPAPTACGYSATQPPPDHIALNVGIWSNASYAGISNFTVHAVTTVVATLPSTGPTPTATSLGQAPSVGVAAREEAGSA
ncbi:MAG: hypothetical protein L3K03_04170 [Thermoplasmata archaeon]|nr:hypothetical protein [Thermoplasmata archaeon]